MSEQEGDLIYEFKKNAIDYIRFSLHKFQGRQFLDIRTFRTFEDSTVRPLVKGIRFEISDGELWERFVEGVHRTDRLLNGEKDNDKFSQN